MRSEHEILDVRLFSELLHQLVLGTVEKLHGSGLIVGDHETSGNENGHQLPVKEVDEFSYHLTVI